MNKHSLPLRGKKGFALVEVLVVVILIAVASSIFYLFGKNTNVPLVAPPTPTSEAVVNEKDEMSDWETYRNNEYSFSIKYPRGWSSSSNSGSVTGGFVSKTLLTSYSPDNVITEGGDSIEGAAITVSVHQDPVTVESYASNFDVDFGGTPKTQEQLTINSIEGTLLTSDNSVVGNKKSFIFEKGGLLYTIDFNWNPNEEKYAALTDQVLSTFQFTNE